MSTFGDDSIFDVFDDEEQKPKRVSGKRVKHEDVQVESVSTKKMRLEDDNKAGANYKSKKETEVEEILNLLETELSSLPKVETLQPMLPGCTHDVAYLAEDGVPALQQRSEKPAKEYPFILDPFQQEALCCLDNNQSVLVSAHTSAGKTSVAEYAIAMSLRDKQRVIYTSPIKALSNQKYRDLQEEFSDVGLMTGDVTINAEASCLVMTTEILRSMLYKGSEIMREVGWVIFDEIHYMRNKERGVVWEETIILLPDNVHYVFLSATIPNARQFAQWICHLHKQPCHVVYTEYRPVPLMHYVFPNGGRGLHLVVDKKGEFREDNFNSAMAILRDVGDNSKSDFQRKGRNGGSGGKSTCFEIIELIKEKGYLPAIIFSFSKRECEFYAKTVCKINFNTPKEQELVKRVYKNAMDSLNEDDQELPQVEATLQFLLRGIGIHHGGLLPIIKETTEILFSEGLIKVLFATETFAMGVNMPAHTVVFTSLQKFDGKDFRVVTGGEYIQMSGRAGRRGKDDCGIVMMMIDEKITPSVGKALVKGSSDPIDSAFRLTYNMVLNLLRVQGINPEYMLEKSFYQFQHYTAIPEMIEKQKELKQQEAEVVIENEDVAMSYYRIHQQIEKYSVEMEEFIQKPKYCVPYLQRGRLVKVRNGTDDFGWGVVVNHQKKTPKHAVGGNPQGKQRDELESMYVVDVLLKCDKDTVRPHVGSSVCSPRPSSMAKSSGNIELAIVPIVLTLIKALSSVVLKGIDAHLDLETRIQIMHNLNEVKHRFRGNIPRMDPIKDLRIKDTKLKEIAQRKEAFEERLREHQLNGTSEGKEAYDLCVKKMKIVAGVKEANKTLRSAKKILQFDELKNRKRVLRRLGYATDADTIDKKGRVASEISAGDELLLTELIFNGVFTDMNPGEIAALLSCFVFDEKTKAPPKVPDELKKPLEKLKKEARHIAQVSTECKIELDEEDYVNSFKTSLTAVVYEWCQGKNFAAIMELTDTYEGSIIRCMRRLEELLREMSNAAKAMGNEQLENKFTEGIELIKRDIVFAASLYL